MQKPTFVTLPTGDLVLASASVTRASLLKNAGVGFFQYPVSIDEEAIRVSGIAQNIPISDITIILAEMKASAAAQKLTIENPVPSPYVLGCDQILAFEEKIYNKPKDIESARSQLFALSGKTHQLYTAAVLLKYGERIWHHLAVAEMTMRSFDNEFIDIYLGALKETAFLSPGSYQIESIGAQLFSQIDGCHYGILGIPLLELMTILREHGLAPIRNASGFDS